MKDSEGIETAKDSEGIKTAKDSVGIGAAKGVGIGAAIGGSGTVVSSAIVSGIGFTSTGVAKASIAASIQSGIGNVAAGSTFAMFQSIGATGAIISSAPIVVVCGAIIGGLYSCFKC